MVVIRKKHWSNRPRTRPRDVRRNVRKEFRERNKRGSRERRFVCVHPAAS